MNKNIQESHVRGGFQSHLGPISKPTFHFLGKVERNSQHLWLHIDVMFGPRAQDFFVLLVFAKPIGKLWNQIQWPGATKRTSSSVTTLSKYQTNIFLQDWNHKNNDASWLLNALTSWPCFGRSIGQQSSCLICWACCKSSPCQIGRQLATNQIRALELPSGNETERQRPRPLCEFMSWRVTRTKLAKVTLSFRKSWKYGFSIPKLPDTTRHLQH